MANKKPKNTKNTKAKTAKKTNEQIAVESAVNAAKKLHKKNPKLLIAIVAIVVTAAIIVGALYLVKPEWFRGPMPESGQLVVHYIDVGQGDCIYVAFPDGTDMLIDCGSQGGSSKYQASAINKLKALNPDGKIDRVMATHSDTDHISYLGEVFFEFQVNNVYMPNIESSYEKSFEFGNKKGTVKELVEKSKLDKFTDDDKIDTLVYAEFFIAALSEPNCNITLNIGKYEIRGQDYTLSEEFLKHVKCEYAVISVGDGNSYGHPEQEALDRLKENGIQKIHRTDKCGNVVLTVSHTGEMAFSCEKQCAA